MSASKVVRYSVSSDCHVLLFTLLKNQVSAVDNLSPALLWRINDCEIF